MVAGFSFFVGFTLEMYIILCLCAVLLSGVTCQQEAVERHFRRLKAAPREVPDFPYTLTYAFDGPLRATHQPDVFKIHNMLLGRRYPEDIIAEGKKAAAFFKRRLGVDFTDEPDETYYLGNVTRDGVTFTPWNLNNLSYYRLSSATDPKTCTKFNNFISDGGWRIIFHTDAVSTGTYTEPIPARAECSYGNYAIRIGVNAEYNSIQNPEFPGPVMNIHYHSKTLLFPPNPKEYGAQVFDCVVTNERLGEGTAQVLVLPQVDDLTTVDENTIWSGNNLITFPEGIPYNK